MRQESSTEYAAAAAVMADGGHGGGREVAPAEKRVLHLIALAGCRLEVELSNFVQNLPSDLYI